MQIRRLGRTGLKVSEICLGTMTFGHQCDEKASFAIMKKAADQGCFFIDTADVYPVPPDPETAGRTEDIIGKWLEGKRHQFVLATKCRIKVGHGANDEGLSRRHILKAVDDSLRRLAHRLHRSLPGPPARSGHAARRDDAGPRRPGPRRQGPLPRLLATTRPGSWRCRCGISEKHGWSRFDCVQPRYNLLYREIETELLPLCRDQGIGVIAYNPLAGGFLSGKYQSLEPGRRAPASRSARPASSTASATGSRASSKPSSSSRSSSSRAANR